ncbi:DUF5615 family PIN-like protein (plasmid) [Synechococcus elongatus PCC 11801]|uniref:DUF5615 family PIN-like protein n=1 Tax=Synechococcus elongatus PCC 11801 TaxID=2219813 RepID=A0ACD5A317_SYNEL
MKFLFDENLSPALVRQASARGYAAESAAHNGLCSKPDWLVFQSAFENDQIIVTANVEDYLFLARSAEVHPGVIIFRNGQWRVEQQLILLDSIFDYLENNLQINFINKVLEISSFSPAEWLLIDIPTP